MAISDLAAIVPPPACPFNTGTDEEWRSTEAEAGFRFPSDYHELFELYGTGVFFDKIYIEPLGHYLLNWAREQVEWLTSQVRNYGEVDSFPYSFFPRPGGLFPIGQEDNGNYVIHWETRGDPDEWRIVVLLYRGSIDFWEFDGNLTGFLATLFRGEFACEGITPQSLDETPPFTPVADWRKAK